MRLRSQREIRLLEPRPRGLTSRSYLRRSEDFEAASASVTPIVMPHDEPALRRARRTRRLRPGVWRGRAVVRDRVLHLEHAAGTRDGAKHVALDTLGISWVAKPFAA